MHVFPLARYRTFLEAQDFAVLLENLQPDAFGQAAYLFHTPKDVWRCYARDDAQMFLRRIDEACAAGSYVAGYWTYEFACLLEPGLRQAISADTLLATVGVFEKPLIWDGRMGRFRGAEPPLSPVHLGREYWLKSWRMGWDEAKYREAFQEVQRALEKGQTYQVNLTDRFDCEYEGSELSLYQDLRVQQPVSYAAYVRDGLQHYLSLSPELFFRRNARGKIVVKPMKGTLARGSNPTEDEQQRQLLKTDAKNMSENVMIVDLLRNDLGRVAKPDTVQVQALCDVEAYPSLWQMTSTITAQVRKDMPFSKIFSALFPCGSVTGAPKIETMKVIQHCEQQPRGIYTGAIGFVAPDTSCVFNVPIRTLALSQGRGVMGAGSGVTVSSRCEDEYAECLLKGLFVQRAQLPFELLETLRWCNTYELLEFHLERLALSAKYFGFVYDQKALLLLLQQCAQGFARDKVYKVRLRLQRDGTTRCRTVQVEEVALDQAVKLTFSLYPLWRSNPFLYHKTSNRDLYRQELARVRKQGCFDVLFFNEKGELCEGAISNIYVEKDGAIFTPPVSCGLLPGVYRKHLLHSQDKSIRERVLYRKDVEEAEALYVSNAVIQWRRATLV